MSQVGAPRQDPVPIGDIATPPFVRLPAPETLFASRAERFRTLAAGSELSPYLTLLAGICDLQHTIQDGLLAVDLPATDAIARAREFGMPPLDRQRFTADAAFDATFERLIAGAAKLEMPEVARAALARVTAADAATQAEMARSVLMDAVPVEAIAEHLFVAAALQVHYSRLAAGLDAKALVPVGDGVCPACGGPPVSSMVVGWQNAHATRFCACATCQTLWNYVRVKCTVCASTKGVSYQEIEGGSGNIKAEICDSCHSYVKILHQHKDPDLDPVADDVASLGLDLLMRETGMRRGGVNPFLIGY